MCVCKYSATVWVCMHVCMCACVLCVGKFVCAFNGLLVSHVFLTVWVFFLCVLCRVCCVHNANASASSVYLFGRVFVCASVCLSVCLSVYPSARSSVHLSIHQSMRLCACMSGGKFRRLGGMWLLATICHLTGKT